MAEEVKAEKKKLHPAAFVFYYSILFFAHWFGSARFDMDGDGDFDPEDVQAWLADKGFVNKNYKRPASKVKGASKSGSIVGKSSSTAGDKAADKEKPAPAAETEKQQGGNWLDRDGDGDVDITDIFQTKVDGEAEEDIAMHKLATGQVVPLFVIIQCTVCFGLWMILSLSEFGGEFITQQGGLDTIWKEQTDLRFYGEECEDLRWQFWRWLTYQFTHVGVVHVTMNVFLNIILGLPLEGAEGHLRMFVMFTAGVFGGALANMFLDGHSVVVGCSGGCYSLIGIHTADLLMNWGQKKFRIPTLVLILLLVSVDIGMGAAAASGDKHVSHTAHVGGAAAGLLIGVIVGKNMKMMAWEKCFYVTAAFLSLFFTVFSLAWIFTRSDGPQSIFEAMAGEDGWCWTRQVADPSLGKGIYCIKCGTQACIDHFTNDMFFSQTVEMSECDSLGWFDHGS